MKVTILISVFSLFAHHLFAIQTTTPQNRSCEMALRICQTTTISYNDLDINSHCTATQLVGGVEVPKSFFFTLTTAFTSGPNLSLLYSGTSAKYRIYGPFNSTDLSNCDLIHSNYFNPSTISFTGSSGVVSGMNVQGTYIIEVMPAECSGTITVSITSNRDVVCENSLDCTSCISSFMPSVGKYVVSTWVKEGDNGPFITNYEHSFLKVSFAGSALNYTFQPSGNIIDGWQKIEGIIEVPIGATGIKLILGVSEGEGYFDDVRFYPFDGSMMSYVYDPITLRLMAELDERNYATFYEYDEEGKLIRVKKETEKGVMTIQENRDNIKKQ
jgi:hypothetical protein